MEKKILDKDKTYFFVGIKGTGMAALACILFDKGYRVLGSDLSKHFFTETELVKRNITILDFNENNIKEDYICIIGNAFLDDFSEVQKAHQLNCQCYRYHQFLGEFLKYYQSICIAGSHGKTTTTGLMATVLANKQAIGYLIGDGTGYLDPDSKDFILEADEFRNHFLAYHPDYAIITNIDWDHVDFFKTEQDYVQAYQNYINQTTKAVIIWGDDPFAHSLNYPCDVYFYGLQENNDITIKNLVETTTSTSFDYYIKGQLFGHFELPFVGTHLLLNSMAVIMVAKLKGYNAEDIEDGLKQYHGVKRRFVIENNGENIYIDDYAHHPTEVKITLQAARKRYPDKKIVAVFKPHRVGRLYHFVDQFVESLKLADEIAVCQFTSIDDMEPGLEDIDIHYLANKLDKCYVFTETQQDAQVLSSLAPAVYVFMSSKDIYPFKEKLKALQTK